MTLFDQQSAETDREGGARRTGLSLSTQATVLVTVMLTAGIGGTTAGGLWISINGLERQASETSTEEAAGAAQRLERLTAPTAANVATALDIVLDDQLRAQAGATAMLVEAAEAAGESTAYIRDTLGQITWRSPMRRIDVVSPDGAGYSSEQAGLTWNQLEAEVRATLTEEPGTTVTTGAVYTADGLMKAAGARMRGGERTVRIEQALNAVEAAATYGATDDQTGRELADQQTGAIAQLVTHAIELAEDAGWGHAAIVSRLEAMVDQTAMHYVAAGPAGREGIYQAGSPVETNAGDGQVDAEEAQGVRFLPGTYDAQLQWVSRARATRANGRLGVRVELRTRAGAGSLAGTAWQVEANRLAALENVTGVWISKSRDGTMRLAAAAPQPGAQGGQDAWKRWDGATRQLALEAERTGQPTARAQLPLIGADRATVLAGASTLGGAVIVIERRVDRMLAQMRNEVLTGLTAAGGLILLIGIGTTTLARRRLTQPVEGIARAAEKLEEGERPPAELTAGLRQRRDEVGSLAFNFDKMTDRMLARHEELGRLVEERTEGLKRANDELRTNQQRMERELELAKTVQESLAPRPVEQIGGLEIASRVTPAKELGGDFVVILQKTDGRVAVAVCDVSGKGVAAGLFMAVARATVHGAIEQEATASQIAETANRALAEGNELEMFVTGWIGLVDPKTGYIEYSCAGHEPPISVRTKGRLRTLEGTGDPPLALVPDRQFHSREHRMVKGETVVAFTDGITDACNSEAIDFGQGRLEQVLGTAWTERPEKTVTRLWNQIQKFSGDTPATDDKTAAVIRREA